MCCKHVNQFWILSCTNHRNSGINNLWFNNIEIEKKKQSVVIVNIFLSDIWYELWCLLKDTQIKQGKMWVCRHKHKYGFSFNIKSAFFHPKKYHDTTCSCFCTTWCNLSTTSYYSHFSCNGVHCTVFVLNGCLKTSS